LPAVALALDAEFTVAGAGGRRTIPAGQFFVTFLTTALQPDEILTEVSFPLRTAGQGWCVQEVARRHGDFALAGAAVNVAVQDGRCCDARVALFGVGPTPVRASSAETMLEGEPLTDAVLDAAAAKAADDVEEPLADIHASSDFRSHLAKVMTRRALGEATSRAQNGDTGV
jgi:CO/xanthine dehydrogenase FAD-binding subunit